MIPSGECSRETKRRRSNELFNIRNRLNMGDNLMSSEVKMLPKEERAVLMKEVNFTVTIPPEQGLAMKADLNIPWNKLRAMRRYCTCISIYMILTIIFLIFHLTDG